MWLFIPYTICDYKYLSADTSLILSPVLLITVNNPAVHSGSNRFVHCWAPAEELREITYTSLTIFLRYSGAYNVR